MAPLADGGQILRQPESSQDPVDHLGALQVFRVLEIQLRNKLLGGLLAKAIGVLVCRALS
jgi:hypothetical protein